MLGVLWPEPSRARRLSSTEEAVSQDADHQRLAAEHRRLLLVLDQVPQACAIFDEGNNFILWNRKYEELFPDGGGELVKGQNIEVTLRSRAYRGFYADAVGREEEWIAERLRNLQRTEWSEERRHGSGRWINTRLTTADGIKIFTYTDITELKNKEASFRLLFESNPVPMWLYETETFRFMGANEAFVELLGYPRSDFRRMSYLQILPEEQLSQLRHVTSKIEGHINPGFNWQLIKADATRADVDIYARNLVYEGKPARLVAAIDITDRERVARELHRAESFLNTVIENAPVPILVKEVKEFRYVILNRAAEEFFGMTKEELIGKTAQDVFPPKSAQWITDHDREALSGEDPTVFTEQRIHTPANGWRLVNSRRIQIRNTRNELTHILVLIEDVTERKRAEAQMLHLAMHDPLTGLPNRAAFNQRIAQVLARSATKGKPFAVICIDVDRFKEVNDVYGHAVGDELLRGVATRLRTVSGTQFLSRPGGDELTLVVEKMSREAVTILSDRLLQSADTEYQIHNHTLKVTLSLGVAFFPEDGEDATTLLANADAALYRSKAEGRGTVRFFKAEMDTQLRERRALLRDLHSAMPNRELVLHYQPQATIAGEIIGFEALARWFHPLRGLVGPSVFIGLAEEGGLIGEIGEWILREACREAASWPEPLQISVNLSPLQVAYSDIGNVLAGILIQTGLQPDRLVLEITESALISNLPRAASIIRRIKALGVKVAMDDFGTGFSSLALLHSLPLDKIKIDKEFVANMARPESAAVIRAVIGLAHDLGLPVLAEGVETERQRTSLAAENCDEIQGYLIGRPQPIDAYVAILQRRLQSAVAQ